MNVKTSERLGFLDASRLDGSREPTQLRTTGWIRRNNLGPVAKQAQGVSERRPTSGRSRKRYRTKVVTGDEFVVSNQGAVTRALVRYRVEQGVGVEWVEESKLTLEDIYTAMVKEDEAE